MQALMNDGTTEHGPSGDGAAEDGTTGDGTTGDGTSGDGTAENTGSSRSEAVAPKGAGERRDPYAGTLEIGTAVATGIASPILSHVD